MSEVMSKFSSGELIVGLGVAMAMVAALVATVSGHWAKVRRAEYAAALKQAMIDRGMSAEDIRTVFEAGSKKSRCDSSSVD
jgi:hypothetical protein